MSFLKKLFGGGGNSTQDAPDIEPVDYNGYSIFPEPINEGSVFRISARIEKDIDGEIKTQKLIRADTVNSVEAANDMSVNKAKQVIDERGDKLFEGSNA
ncbi:HlyU family transcriptional regulator [uncultured Shimia sp.]|uniref:HlyU family transcriptional regulator n=1 Tax=uncultured Shimia sp. TaxID=573152 RepID=UPI00260D1340|nr:HlyU family transcriptional regulator [uncultured Shimia sp.]